MVWWALYFIRKIQCIDETGNRVGCLITENEKNVETD